MKNTIIFFLLIFILASCHKDPDMSKLDSDFVVYTDHDSETNFSSFSTFYIPDSVLVISNYEKPRYWTEKEAEPIISTLVHSMESRGYTRTYDKGNTDLGLQASYVESVEYFTNWYDNGYWWWGYPGYWGPDYWGSYWNGWYYPYPVYYSYSVGSLLVEMTNPLVPSPHTINKLPVVWTAYIGGLLSGSNKIDMGRSVNAIEQAFVQSPYVRK